MNPKPMLENGESTPDPARIVTPEAVSPKNELPIASALPGWDLLPSDAVLVRRRPVRK